jgi:hypothetical protein
MIFFIFFQRDSRTESILASKVLCGGTRPLRFHSSPGRIRGGSEPKALVSILGCHHRNRQELERSARCYRAMTCSLVMGRKVRDILQILGGGLIP